ncbi:MAG: hypothetical protein KF851_17260 [Pirellulaceae bacterium]|jgi:hypothetical protein|nr:hypothetical protein [Pirellulaceae bacterium]
MKQLEEIFADTIGEISLAGGMVRMDLVSLVGNQGNDENKPRFEPKCRIVMPPEGFLRSFSAMENLVKQLIDAGLIRPNQPGNGPVGGSAPVNPTPKSPNF